MPVGFPPPPLAVYIGALLIRRVASVTNNGAPPAGHFGAVLDRSVLVGCLPAASFCQPTLGAQEYATFLRPP